MVIKKRFILMSFIYSVSLFVSPTISQDHSEIIREDIDLSFHRNSDTHLPINHLYNSNQLLKVDGSPFNSNDNPQIDSVIIKLKRNEDEYESVKYLYEYDSNGNVSVEVKENYYRQMNSYDSLGIMRSYIFQFWQNNTWVNFDYLTFQYDSLNRLTNYVIQEWDGQYWVNYEQVNYYYNSNGDMDSFLSQGWDGFKWVNAFRRTNTYDSNYVLTEALFQNWGNGNWTGTSWKNFYEFDDRGNRILYLTQDLIDGEWINVRKWTYEYDINNNNILSKYDLWANGIWNNYRKWTNSFDKWNNMSSSLFETFDSDEWINTEYTQYHYDELGYLLTAFGEEWFDSVWTPSNNSIFMYDDSGNRRAYRGTELSVYYAQKTNVKIESGLIDDFHLSQNYPNPFNPSTIIRYSVAYQSLVQLRVFDLLGREIAVLVNKEQQAGKYEVKFNGGNLSSGVYIYKLQNGHLGEAKKMMVIK